MLRQQSIKDGVKLFFIFVKGMAFAFTSGQAALPILEKEIVDKRQWMTEQEFWLVPAVSHTLPGVISLHNAIQYGSVIAGPFGAFMAVLATICTAFFSMLLVAWVFSHLLGNQGVTHFVQGIRAVSIAVLLSGAVRLVKSCKQDFFSYILIAVSILLPLVFGVSTFVTIICCGVIGIVFVVIRHEKGEDVSELSEEDAE